MKSTKSKPSGWSCIDRDVLWKLVSILAKDEPWRAVAGRFLSVNRHWRNIVREHFTVVNPRHHGPFIFARDAYTLSKYPNLDTLVVKHAGSWEEGWYDLKSLHFPFLNFSKLKRLKICQPPVLEPVLSRFRGVQTLTELSLNQGSLTRNLLLHCLTQLTGLKILSLKKLDIESCGLFIGWIKKSANLEILDLSVLRGLSDKKHSCVPSVSAFSCLHQLKFLRISTKNFNLSSVSSLARLSQLTALVLDEKLNGDKVNLASLPYLVHLSICSTQVPQWLPEMSELKSLALRTSDSFKSEQSQDALLKLAPQLTSLQLIRDSPLQIPVGEFLASTKDLEKLKMSGVILMPSDIQHCQKLKELRIKAQVQSKQTWSEEFVPTIWQLPELQSLTLDMKDPFFMWFLDLETENQMSETLTKLVIHQMTDESVTLVIQNLHQLRDWRIFEDGYSLRPFADMDPDDLQFLKNLCLPEVSCGGYLWDRAFWDRHFCHEQTPVWIRFMNLDLLTRLEHLALPTHSLRAVRNSGFHHRAPHVLVDDDPDWNPDEFPMFP